MNAFKKKQTVSDAIAISNASGQVLFTIKISQYYCIAKSPFSSLIEPGFPFISKSKIKYEYEFLASFK